MEWSWECMGPVKVTPAPFGYAAEDRMSYLEWMTAAPAGAMVNMDATFFSQRHAAGDFAAPRGYAMDLGWPFPSGAITTYSASGPGFVRSRPRSWVVCWALNLLELAVPTLGPGVDLTVENVREAMAPGWRDPWPWPAKLVDSDRPRMAQAVHLQVKP